MTISINNPVQATYIFLIIFIAALFISLRRKKESALFPPSLTNELKGFAILLIVFSHISYFLAEDHRFLYPLSIMAGVGVNLFLFISGFGLTISALKNKLSIGQFYRRRLPKLFIPFWLALISFLLLDFFVLKIVYSWEFIIKATAGIFTSADIYHDLNSPLWYFTLILFYYLIFGLVFLKKQPWLSAIIIYMAAYLIVKENPVLLYEVMPLYKIHIIAFPLGIVFGWLFYKPNFFSEKLKQLKILSRLGKNLKLAGYYLLSFFLIILICYLAYYSGVGQSADKEQFTSILIGLLIVLLFLLKKVEFKLLHIFGLYSYEIYLFHWPLMYRYDLFYKYLPAWLATIFYLFLFLVLGWGLNKLSKNILNRISRV
jgi:peptidoglycan/LPS O-acetylase OafA/YrhL